MGIVDRKYLLAKSSGVTWDEHSRRSREFAEALLALLPPYVRELFPEGSAAIVGLHDIGKVTPPFQRLMWSKMGDCAGKSEVLNVFSGSDVSDYKHDHVSAGNEFMRSYLKSTKRWIFEAVGSHHGRLLENSRISYHDYYGGHEWDDYRREMISGLLGDVSCFPKKIDEAQFELLKGLISVSDWLASGYPDFQKTGQDILKDIGFISRPSLKEISFKDVFGFGKNEVQELFTDTVKGRGTYILEAQMGVGKTEAAFWAAYNLVKSGKAAGICFLLPTKLTSNMVFNRFERFLSKISDVKPTLMHGEAMLRRMLGDLDGRDFLEDNPWFRKNVRTLLAPFVVGTVDQVLMSVISAKFNFVRSFGLAGKVVIIDEVHCYDSFTGTHIDTLVRLLEKIGCTVILLSATLTKKRRAELLGGSVDRDGYPLVSRKDSSGISCFACKAGKDKHVYIRKDVCPSDAVTEVKVRVKAGHKVLWLENTVDAAVNVYRALRQEGLKVGLVHSRFTSGDRKKKEELWTREFASGRKGGEGCVLVGTQVLEQSLDLDADFMVTALCPVDVFFQRIGRLWRSEKSCRPEGLLRCEAWILECDIEKASPIYSKYLLVRAAECLGKVDSVSVPSGLSSLLDEAYSDRDEEPVLSGRNLKKDMDSNNERLKRLAKEAQSPYSLLGDSGTRYSDIKTTSLLLLKDIDLKEKRFVFADGSSIVLSEKGKAHFYSLVKLNTVSFPVLKRFESISGGIPNDSLYKLLDGYCRSVCLVDNDALLTLKKESAGASYIEELGLF